MDSVSVVEIGVVEIEQVAASFRSLFAGVQEDFVDAALRLSRGADPNELIQQAVTNGLKSFHQFESTSDEESVAQRKFFRWLLTILINCRHDHFRYLARAPSQCEDFGVVEDKRVKSESWIDAEVIAAELRKLDDLDRKIVLLNRIEGYTDKQIAAMLGSTENAIRTRRHRAENKLRRLLAPHYPELDGDVGE